MPRSHQWAVCCCHPGHDCEHLQAPKNSLKLVKLPMVPSKTQKSLCGMQQAACCRDQQACTAQRSCYSLQP